MFHVAAGLAGGSGFGYGDTQKVVRTAKVSELGRSGIYSRVFVSLGIGL
jgi:hypothetical protein